MKTKICKSCTTEKLISEFYTNGWSGGNRNNARKYHAECKGCFNENVKKRFYERLTEALDGKPLACEICDFDEHPHGLDFHHRDPSKKEIGITQLKAGCSLARIKKEVEKCTILCALCHRLVHAGVRTIPE